MTSTKKNICIVLGTRPEAIKLAPVIKSFQEAEDFDTKVILTGQHREMVSQVMGLFDLKADFDLDIMQTKQSLGDITCRSLQGLEKIYHDVKPDLVITQGDTTTAFAASLGAFYQQIPVAHVEAGLRTDNIYNPFPEEANRRLISQIAQLHFAPTTLAVENLHKSGVTGEIHHTGNTVIDALLSVAENNPFCEVKGLDWQKYRVLLVTVHRRENWGEPLQDIITGLKSIVEQYPDTAILLPLHRNPIVREPLKKHLGNHERIFLVEPLDYEQLVGAIKNCFLLLTDSGGIQEEAPSLGKPVLVLRDTTERPEAVTAGTAKLIGTRCDRIFDCTSELLTKKESYQQMAEAINPFGDGKASERILGIVRQYFKNKN